MVAEEFLKWSWQVEDHTLTWMSESIYIGADALSRNAVQDCSSGMDLDNCVLCACTEEKTNDNVSDLLTACIPQPSVPEDSQYQEQRKDPKLAVLELLKEWSFPYRGGGGQKNCCISQRVYHSG